MSPLAPALLAFTCRLFLERYRSNRKSTTNLLLMAAEMGSIHLFHELESEFQCPLFHLESLYEALSRAVRAGFLGFVTFLVSSHPALIARRNDIEYLSEYPSSPLQGEIAHLHEWYLLPTFQFLGARAADDSGLDAIRFMVKSFSIHTADCFSDFRLSLLRGVIEAQNFAALETILAEYGIPKLTLELRGLAVEATQSGSIEFVERVSTALNASSLHLLRSSTIRHVEPGATVAFFEWLADRDASFDSTLLVEAVVENRFDRVEFLISKKCPIPSALVLFESYHLELEPRFQSFLQLPAVVSDYQRTARDVLQSFKVEAYKNSSIAARLLVEFGFVDEDIASEFLRTEFLDLSLEDMLRRDDNKAFQAAVVVGRIGIEEEIFTDVLAERSWKMALGLSRHFTPKRVSVALIEIFGSISMGDFLAALRFCLSHELFPTSALFTQIFELYKDKEEYVRHVLLLAVDVILQYSDKIGLGEAQCIAAVSRSSSLPPQIREAFERKIRNHFAQFKDTKMEPTVQKTPLI